jgi:hypothetical protein
MNILRQSKSILILTALMLSSFDTQSLTIDYDRSPNLDEVRANIAWFNDHHARKDKELARKDRALEKARRENELLREQVGLQQTEMSRLTEVISVNKDAENIFRRATQLFVEAGGSLVQVSTNMRPFVEKALSNMYNTSRLRGKAVEDLITNVLSSHLPPIGRTVTTEVDLLAQLAKGDALLAQRPESPAAASSIRLAASVSANTSIFDLGSDSEGKDKASASPKALSRTERSASAGLSEIESSVFDLDDSGEAEDGEENLNDSRDFGSLDELASPAPAHLALRGTEKPNAPNVPTTTPGVTRSAPSSPLRSKNLAARPAANKKPGAILPSLKVINSENKPVNT